MTAYASAAEIAQAVASGSTDFGLAGYTADAFSYAGEGLIKFVAAQVSEKHGFEGNEVVASMVAWTNGLRRVEDLGGNSVAFARSTGRVPAHRTGARAATDAKDMIDEDLAGAH